MIAPRPLLFTTLMALSAACGQGRSGTSGSPADGGAAPCPGCLVEPPETCPAGAAPLLGNRECSPVGPRCADGFERDPSGFGCVPVLPAKRCTGATRDEIGSGDCVPVGDCDAPFPPPNASLFVEPGVTGAGQFPTIAAAIAAAKSGDVIAVEAGTYPEPLTVDGDFTIVGRCARDVIVAPPASEFALVSGGRLGVRGVTFRGGMGVVSLQVGGELTLEDVIVDGAVGNGVSASKATLKLRRSAVRSGRPEGAGPAFGVFAVLGAKVEVEASVVSDHAGVATYATDPDTVIRMTRTVLRDITAVGQTRDGFGIEDRARLEFIGSALIGPVRHAILLEKGASAAFERSTFWHVVHGGAQDPGLSIGVDASTMTAEDFTIADASGIGISTETAGSRATLKRCALVGMNQGGSATRALTLSRGGTMTLEDSVIEGALGVAALLSDTKTRLSLVRSLVTGSRDLSPSQFAIGVKGGASLAMETATITDSRGIAVVASDEGTTASLMGVIVRGVEPASLFGIGVYVNAGARGTLTDTVIQGASAVGLVTSSASAAFTSGVLRGNGVALQVQRGTRLREGDGDPAKLDLLVSGKVRLEGNGARTGSGELPLPEL